MKKIVETLIYDLAKFTQREENLDILLKSQRVSFNKSGLGYNSFQDQKLYNDGISKSSPVLCSCNLYERFISKAHNPINHDVLLVDGLQNNLRSICQLCDKGCHALFKSSHCIIESINDHIALQRSFWAMGMKTFTLCI